MTGRCDMTALGRQLALMHLAKPSEPNAAAGRFGFPVDNTIGGTPQENGWMDSWVDFYAQRRLAPQLKRAGDATLQRLGDRLLGGRALEALMEGAGPITSSVLHGDLWSGNIAGASADGQPTIFDPACYYGHHEAEFGMAWCAGFTEPFYR